MDTQRHGVILESDKIADELYYFKDILSVGEPRLTRLLKENLLNGFGSDLSTVTSVYIISRLLQVVWGRSGTNNAAGFILYHFVKLNVRSSSKRCISDFHDKLEILIKFLEKFLCQESTSVDGAYIGAHWKDFMSSFKIVSSRGETCSKSEDEMTDRTSKSKAEDESIFDIFTPEILNALLLAFQQPLSIMILWHAGWCMRRVLFLDKRGLDADNLLLFTTSYDQSRVKFLKELDGVWFDHIPDTLITEWASCKRVLDQPSVHKDPLFMLELVLHQEPTDGQASSYFAWQRMVDAVKLLTQAFVLFFQLKTFIFNISSFEEPKLNMISSSNDSGVFRASNISSASFGSNVSLESGIPCGIAFSNSEIRDIYVIPVASGIIGKLLLAEKHPFRSRHGVVIAIAPLAGLCVSKYCSDLLLSSAFIVFDDPKIDEDHSSWLHLRIREFDPQFYSIKARGNHLNMPDHSSDGRWTLGFPNAKACEEAQFAILNEIDKLRSAVKYMLAPLLEDDFGLAEN
ncbi:unnamed protein product [Sphenostylis stenocarpa]|uniref:Uncharacterized protein n=1 Tax=Sphenostylis stenocarpa TaxID=92480 RepID=A0AA86T895_9FABA|nr:unnamed protein product [Sphenostylis stenocarpa]